MERKRAHIYIYIYILKAYATAASPLALPNSASCSCGLFLGNILGHLGHFWDMLGPLWSNLRLPFLFLSGEAQEHLGHFQN